jgi:glycosyltransferase involved in cell wall biosynthesis
MDVPILILSKQYHPYASGSGVNARYFAEYLVRNDLQTKVVSLNYFFGNPARETLGGVSIYRLPMPMNNRYYQRLAAPFLLFPFYLWHIFRSRSVYIFGPLHGYFAIILLSKLLGRKVVFQSLLTGADDAASILRRYRWCRPFAACCLSSADVYHAITPQLAGIFKQALPRASHKVLDMCQGYDPHIFRKAAQGEKEKLRAKYGLPQGKPIIISVGNLIERKGYAGIFEALAGISADYCYIIAGNTDNNKEHFFWQPVAEMDRLAQMGRKLLGNKLILAGYTLQVPELLRCADLLLHNGLQEGMPNILLEASASGLPIISHIYGKSAQVEIHYPISSSLKHQITRALADLETNTICSSKTPSSFSHVLAAIGKMI